MQIGTFLKTETGVFQGRIQTLTFQADIQFLPVEEKVNDNQPDYRIVTIDDDIEIGAGWFKKSKSDKPYVSCKIDDPVFPSPLWPILMGEQAGDYRLYWDRPSPKTNPVSNADKGDF